MPNLKKTVLLASDGRTNVQINKLADNLNRICKYINFSCHKIPIDLGGPFISNPRTYSYLRNKISSTLRKKHSLILIATELPYDNNFFFDSDENVIVMSFNNWNNLTSLSMNNGMVNFICKYLASDLNSDLIHYNNTGCTYDFLQDKRGIDARMRSGILCEGCLTQVQENAKKSPNERLPRFDCTIAQGIDDLMSILDENSLASKRGIDVLDRWDSKAGVPQVYDVFLCHNSKDKPEIRKLYAQLKERKIRPWFDEEHLRPGISWQRELEAKIPQIKAAAIIVGRNGQGPWQEFEQEAFLREFVKRACPVIPVLLNVRDVPQLPLFLQSLTWVDFRKSNPDPWKRLIWGITGNKQE